MRRYGAHRRRGASVTASRWAASCLVAAVSGMAGCYADDPQPVGYAVETGAPVDIETYPSVVYLGEPAYFYGDRWWHRGGGGWAYYRSEPAELRAQREVVRRQPRRVRAAPRAAVRAAPREEHQERR